MRKMKSILALGIVLLMILSCIPFTAIAAGETFKIYLGYADNTNVADGYVITEATATDGIKVSTFIVNNVGDAAVGVGLPQFRVYLTGTNADKFTFAGYDKTKTLYTGNDVADSKLTTANSNKYFAAGSTALETTTSATSPLLTLVIKPVDTDADYEAELYLANFALKDDAGATVGSTNRVVVQDSASAIPISFLKDREATKIDVGSLATGAAGLAKKVSGTAYTAADFGLTAAGATSVAVTETDVDSTSVKAGSKVNISWALAKNSDGTGTFDSKSTAEQWAIGTVSAGDGIATVGLTAAGSGITVVDDTHIKFPITLGTDTAASVAPNTAAYTVEFEEDGTMDSAALVDDAKTRFAGMTLTVTTTNGTTYPASIDTAGTFTAGGDLDIGLVGDTQTVDMPVKINDPYSAAVTSLTSVKVVATYTTGEEGQKQLTGLRLGDNAAVADPALSATNPVEIILDVNADDADIEDALELIKLTAVYDIAKLNPAKDGVLAVQAADKDKLEKNLDLLTETADIATFKAKLTAAQWSTPGVYMAKAKVNFVQGTIGNGVDKYKFNGYDEVDVRVLLNYTAKTNGVLESNKYQVGKTDLKSFTVNVGGASPAGTLVAVYYNSSNVVIGAKEFTVTAANAAFAVANNIENIAKVRLELVDVAPSTEDATAIVANPLWVVAAQ